MTQAFPQTSYTYDQPNAVAGQIADAGHHDILSFNNATALDLPFGIGVVRGYSAGSPTTPEECIKKPSASTDDFMGVVVFQHDINQLELAAGGLASDTLGLPIKRRGGIMRQGRVYVLVEQTVAYTDPVYLRYTANTYLPGGWRKDADSSKAVLISGARWIKGATSGNLAVLEFDADIHRALSQSAATVDPTLRTELAAVTQGAGSALVGLYDANSRYSGAELQTAMQENLVLGDVQKITYTPGVSTGGFCDVVCAITDMLGNAISGARQVVIRALSVTGGTGKNVLAAATSEVGTIISSAGANAAAGPSCLLMDTGATGLFSFKVTDSSNEALFVWVEAEGCRPLVKKITISGN